MRARTLRVLRRAETGGPKNLRVWHETRGSRRGRDRRSPRVRARAPRVQRDDRARRELRELIVEREDLSPVRRAVAVDRVDGRLDLIRPRAVDREAATHDRLPLADEIAIPESPILFA